MIARVLTVAGSDSGGGAGIQADLKVMTAHSVYGLSVITAITSQNTLKVDAVEVVQPDMVEKQFRAVISDIGCDVIKFGMLGNRDIVVRMGKLLAEFELTQTVVDPVMIATTGARLLEHEAIQSFIHDLLPKSLILTPNIQEAKLLLAEARGVLLSEISDIKSIEDMKGMAVELQALGPRYVLVKGGHVPLDDQMRVCDTASRSIVADVLTDGKNTTVMTSVWSPTRNTHGTGCTLASAIACNLALKHDIHTAVSEAISYVHGAIIHSFDLGSGNGPLNHMYRQQSLPFTP